MQERYGIDLDEPGLLDDRSWRWLKVRIRGIALMKGTRLRSDLYPDET